MHALPPSLRGPRRLPRTGTALALALALALVACPDGGSASSDVDPEGSADVPDAAPARRGLRLGEACFGPEECLSGVCLKSEYGPPFCTRGCADPGIHCDPGPDAADGEALCVSFEDLPNPASPAFRGDMDTFCIPRCSNVDGCEANNGNWEVCDIPRYYGDPVSGIGQIKICAAPSFQGKDPVDPLVCDWEKTIGRFGGEGNLCRRYCEYLVTCKEVDRDYDEQCCAWGCFNRMIFEDQVADVWHDYVDCYVDFHSSYPPVGEANFCSEPRRACGGVPIEPTPPAAL